MWVYVSLLESSFTFQWNASKLLAESSSVRPSVDADINPEFKFSSATIVIDHLFTLSPNVKFTRLG